MGNLRGYWRILVVAVAVAASAAHLGGGTMTLRNTAGDDIQAEILSVEGEELTIRRADGTEFTFGMNLLDEASRQKVRQWALNHIPAEAFAVTIKDRTEEKVDMSSNSRNYLIKRTQFHFDIEYNHNLPLKDLRIEYLVFYTEERMGRPPDDYDQELIWADELAVPLLEPESETRISSTRMLSLEESSMKPGWSISGGYGGRVRDRIDGIWMRLYRGDEIIHEHSEPSKIMEKEKWDFRKTSDPFARTAAE